MKALLVAAVLFLGVAVSGSAFAAEEHSENVCSAVDANVCAHLGFHWGMPKSDGEGQFMFHVMLPEGVEATDVAVTLWMDLGNGSGHGADPVELTKMAANKYMVSKAFFPMAGEWLVKTTFKIGDVEHKIDFALNIAE